MREVRYPTSGGAWSHYLHGNVPGHQLDWIARPLALPAGLSPQHVQHLLDIIQVHDVPSPGEHNLTFANLSLKDVTHRPGFGGLGVVAHFRMPSSLDHGGRKNPRFVHALVAAGLPLDPHAVFLAASGLIQATVDDRVAPDRPVDHWYEAYQRAAEGGPEAALDLLQSYFESFPPMPVVVGGVEIERWSLSEGAVLPREVVVRCGPRTPEGWRQATTAMAGLASVLYHARVPWAAITTGVGRGSDDGVVVRFAFATPGAPDDGLALNDLPADPVELAFSLLPLEEEREQRFVPVSRWVNPATGERVMTPPRVSSSPSLVPEEEGSSPAQPEPSARPAEPSARPAEPPPQPAMEPAARAVEPVRPPEPLARPAEARPPEPAPRATGDAGVEEGPPAITTLPSPPEVWPPPRPVEARGPHRPPHGPAHSARGPDAPGRSDVPPPPPASLAASDLPTPPPKPPKKNDRPAIAPRVWLSLLLGGALGAIVLAVVLVVFNPNPPPPRVRPAPPATLSAPAPTETAPAPTETAPAPTETAPTETTGNGARPTVPRTPRTPKQESAASSGMVVIAGDASEVRIDGRPMSAGPHSLSPGSHKLSARFPDLDESQSFGTLSIKAGQTVTVRCSSAAYTCSVTR